MNTTLADLKGPIDYTFQTKTPLIEMLDKRGRVSTERGTLIERVIMGGSPAQGTGIFGGGETLNMQRTEQTHKIQLQTHRIVIPINIPKKAMKENDGKLGAIKLIETYPVAVSKALPVDKDRFFFSGVSNGITLPTSEMEGWNTLNAQKTFARGVIGVTNGLIPFAAPAAQSGTTQNLARSSAYGYVSQYGAMTSFANDGEKVYRRVRRECGQYNPTDVNAGPDVMFMDFDSFALFEDARSDKNRTVVIQDKIDNANTDELWIGNMRCRAAKNIILSDFTGAAASGVCYLLTLNGFEYVMFQKGEMSDFDDRVANQDCVTAKYEEQGALLVQGLRMQGAVTGGALP